MDEQRDEREVGERVKWIRSTRRERLLAFVLSLVYAGGWGLAIYAGSNRLEDQWPARVFAVVFAIWFLFMLVLPLVIVCWFFGGRAGSPAWLRGQFTTRALLILTTIAAIALGAIVWAAEFFDG